MKKSNKVVLITGGSSGIGLALAKIFLENKNTVIITGRNQSKLEAAKKALPEFHIMQNDVTSSADIQALVQKTESEFNGIDVLVNNAGVYHGFDLNKENHSLDKQPSEIDIDFAGPLRMVHYFLPQLKRSTEAAIVNVSSGLAFVPLTQAPVYSATKAAVHAWTQSIRLHLKPSNIRVIELMPPVVDTEMVADLTGDVPKKMAPSDLATAFWKGYLKNQEEITPGLSGQLKLMRRLAPGFIFNQLNKQAVPG